MAGTVHDAMPALRPRVTGALAAAAAIPALAAEADASVESRHMPRQRALFVDRSQPKVIPFESLSGRAEPVTPPAAPRPAATRPTPPRPAPPRATATRPASPGGTAQGTRERRPAGTRSSDQRSLDFLPPAAPTSRKLKTTVEAVIYCDAPVASKMHRAVAAALDASMILIAFGVFLLTFHLAGGEFTLDRTSLAVFGISYVIIALFYDLLWTLGQSETPGRRWTQLRLINFDGFPPDQTQRVLRLLGSSLGLCAAGLGVLWVTADEESLAWHDHISKTFLTFSEQDTNFVRQR